MGYGFYEISSTTRRPEDNFGGYYVLATCDKRGCENEIDRGLGHLCGQNPHDIYSNEPGCGRYYCGDHLGFVGERGGCSHGRRGRAWGRILSDMARAPNGDYCCDRIGHDGLHAWARTNSDTSGGEK